MHETKGNTIWTKKMVSNGVFYDESKIKSGTSNLQWLTVASHAGLVPRVLEVFPSTAYELIHVKGFSMLREDDGTKGSKPEVKATRVARRTGTPVSAGKLLLTACGPLCGF